MSDPRRMLDTNVPPHIRVLMEAGRGAEPHSALVETTLQSLRAADLGAASGGLGPLVSSAVVPVLAGLLALSVLAGVTWTIIAPAPAPPVAPGPPAQTPLRIAPPDEEPADAELGAAAASSSAPENRATSQVVAQPEASAPSTARGASRTHLRASTTAQRDLVLRARAALDGGSPQQALAILAGYEASFDELRFVPEVLSLRMQAHQRVGNVQAAEQLAQRIVSAYPRSSQAGRARQLLRDRKSGDEND